MTYRIYPVFQHSFNSNVWKIIASPESNCLIIECKNLENWETEIYFFDLLHLEIEKIIPIESLPLWASHLAFFDDNFLVAIEPPEEKPGFGRLIQWKKGISMYTLDTIEYGEILKKPERIIWKSLTSEVERFEISLPQLNINFYTPEEYFPSDAEYHDLKKLLKENLTAKSLNYTYLEIIDKGFIIGIKQSELRYFTLESDKLQTYIFFTSEEKKVTPKSFCRFGKYLIVVSDINSLHLYEL